MGNKMQMRTIRIIAYKLAEAQLRKIPDSVTDVLFMRFFDNECRCANPNASCLGNAMCR
jgi:hypothetical protein